jgi:flagellar P-ring protein precursor FlgI
VLVDTPLEAFDGRVYAVAGGPVNLSGFSASGAGGGVSKNHDTSGKVEAQIEVEMSTEPAFPGNKFRLLLLNKDYATAHRIANEINRYFPGSAWAGDPSRVEVTFPPTMIQEKLAFVTKIGSLTVAPDEPARVVINQKTGTIVVGQNVKLSRVVFANENLVITTNETPIASQPAPFSQGQTAILPRTQLTATETGGTYNQLSHNSTVGDLANILNTLGVRPRDLINIFHDLRASGALQAQLILE